MKYFIGLIFIFIFFWMASLVGAVSDPPLFTCVNPLGDRIASYNSGTHGIPGDTGSHTGSDEVFRIDQDHVLQCFCPNDSTNGIQSNWWNVRGLTESERDSFVRRGWVLVPDGSAWGLARDPYLVKNDAFSCAGGVGGARSGDVLSASTLAATGNTQQLLMFALGAVVFGWATYKFSRE